MTHINNVTNFLRSDHFTNADNKTILEIFVTQGLDNPTVAGANADWLVYDVAAKSIAVKNVSAASLIQQDYQLDHLFERQYISGLLFRKIHQSATTPPLDILNDIISLANIPKNLIWIPKAVHTAKSLFFSPARPVLKLDPVRQYLDLAQPIFKAGVDAFSLVDSHDIVKQVVGDLKLTPWYLGGWAELDNEFWYE